ncbi:MAG: class C sortase [Clostridia bacterium]|nr:class C sortase [Clostridia bacterium]
MKLKTITKILIIAFIIGLSLLLYPSFSNYWNLKHATQAVNEFSEQLADIDDADYEAIWASAVDYNAALNMRDDDFALPNELQERYYNEIKLSGNGLMGYVDIPSIGVSLPIYHGTSSDILQIGIGHLEWSSLPTGGMNTHCVLSGHRGLPSAKLFTDLNKLREGDTFTLNILNEVLTYEVDQIRTVIPNELGDLIISEDNDYCTLVTCTPYAVNSHRLLVRGHRIATEKKGATVISEAVLVDQLIVAFYLGLPLIIIMFLTVMLKRPPKKKTSSDTTEEELL